MESVLEHFVHMVLCKCAVVLIKAKTMKPSLSDAVWQGENAETVVSKGNAFPNNDVLTKQNLGKIACEMYSLLSHSLFLLWIE